MAEVRIRTSLRLGVFALAVAVVGAILALVFESLRSPLFLFVLAALFLSCALLLLDRRVKLSLSDAGVRYSEWGPAIVPWQEFSGYRWVSWRGQLYLQLVPRRPSELAESFSAYGKLNHFCHGLVRMPRFGINANRLDLPGRDLEEHVGRFLPPHPPG